MGKSDIHKEEDNEFTIDPACCDGPLPLTVSIATGGTSDDGYNADESILSDSENENAPQNSLTLKPGF